MAEDRYDIVLCRPEAERLTVETLSAHSGLHPSLVARFVELGLIEPIEWQGTTLLFDASAVSRLRTVSRLRESLGINLAGVAVILDLLDRFCALQQANESLRSRL